MYMFSAGMFMTEGGATLPASNAHVVDGEKILLIGIDGELQWFDFDKLEPISEAKRPFPAPVSRSMIIEGHLMAFWVEHDILAARMASLDLSAEFSQGAHKSEVRAAMQPSPNRPPPVEVAGAKWSRILDAEPLGLCELEGRIAFVLWKRGIYCLSTDAEEYWRVGELNWSELEDLPRAQEVCGLHNVGGDLLAWSRGGGWARLSGTDGSTLEKGRIEIPASIIGTYYSPESGWLLGSNRGHLVRLKELGDEPVTIDVGGPISAALWDEEVSGWRICGWRENLLWNDTELKRSERDELCVQLLKHPTGWKVLENTGRWCDF